MLTEQNTAPTNEKARITQAADSATGKRWCGYHQGHAPLNDGGYVDRNGKRWMCGSCQKLRGIGALKT